LSTTMVKVLNRMVWIASSEAPQSLITEHPVQVMTQQAPQRVEHLGGGGRMGGGGRGSVEHNNGEGVKHDGVVC
jgi:hypothetical protein